MLGMAVAVGPARYEEDGKDLSDDESEPDRRFLQIDGFVTFPNPGNPKSILDHRLQV